MYPGPIKAYFFNAQDARRAMNALQMSHATVSDPVPIQKAHEGRWWMLTISPPIGTVSPLYADPNLLDQVIGIVMKCNGVTSQGAA